MKYPLITLTTALSLILSSSQVLADHNSKNGEGWANMPNDIHNMRVETLDNNDNEAFRDFVKFGGGADSENRFDTEDARPEPATGQKGNERTSRTEGRPESTKRNDAARNNSTGDKGLDRIRSRFESATSTRSQLYRSTGSMRGASNRRGGGRR